MEAISELEIIKWLLVAILVGMVVIAIASVILAVIFWYGLSIVREQYRGRVFREIAEDHLAKNEISELEEYVEERLKSHPQDVWAHWYMGKQNTIEVSSQNRNVVLKGLSSLSQVGIVL